MKFEISTWAFKELNKLTKNSWKISRAGFEPWNSRMAARDGNVKTTPLALRFKIYLHLKGNAFQINFSQNNLLIRLLAGKKGLKLKVIFFFLSQKRQTLLNPEGEIILFSLLLFVFAFFNFLILSFLKFNLVFDFQFEM